MNKLDLVNCEDIDDDLMAQFRHAASRLAERLRTYRRHIADTQSEFDRLTAELDGARDVATAYGVLPKVTRTRETVDGVDCERISGLDVIVPVGLIPDGESPKEVRSWAIGLPPTWLSDVGRVMGAETPTSAIGARGKLRLVLADRPAPAPVPTWTPPVSLPDGEYTCGDDFLERGSHTWDHRVSPSRWKDYVRPANGRWQVESGRATYLGPNEETPR